jgi:hypothetical protein
MKTLLKFEELMIFIVSIFLYSREDFSWLFFVVLLFVPDVSMLGYIISRHFGAFLYNVVHSRALSFGLYMIGYVGEDPIIKLIAIMLIAHVSMDRFFGYGLKHPERFDRSHLD